jgi:hypothetical protein
MSRHTIDSSFRPLGLVEELLVLYLLSTSVTIQSIPIYNLLILLLHSFLTVEFCLFDVGSSFGLAFSVAFFRKICDIP